MNTPAPRQGTEVSTPSSNPFTDYGNQASQKAIVGTLLRFSKGDYFAGQDDEEVPMGTKFVANLDEMMVGWIRWEQNRPTDHIMGKVSDSFSRPGATNSATTTRPVGKGQRRQGEGPLAVFQLLVDVGHGDNSDTLYLHHVVEGRAQCAGEFL